MDIRKYNVHMIGNAHIDPVWLWQWQEGFQAAWSTFRSALDRMKETPDFVFTCAQAAVYKWMENADPDMFEEIKERVKEGRWRVVGGWWMQPDCNIPGGEAFVRQALYGQRYFHEKFGVYAKVGYNVDSFGHNGMLPQLLKKSKMDYYVFMRPGVHEKPGIPNLFWWESNDGSKVLAYRIEGSYNVGSNRMREYTANLPQIAPDGVADLMEFYGVGNHGGGPTKENLALIQEMKELPDMPNVLFSSPEQYFNTIMSYNPDLPVIRDDLQHHASGCYSVNRWVKAMNRKSEQLLMASEVFSTLSTVMGKREYPYAEFGKAWENVLFNQFHDIMAGSSIKEAYEDARDFYGESLKITSDCTNYALNSLIRHIDTRGEGIPLIVFNSLSWARKTAVEFEMQGIRSDDNGPRAVIKDDDGNIIPSQVVTSSATVGRGRVRIVFVDTLPAMGYKMYRVFLGEDQPESACVTISKDAIENQKYRIAFDQRTGWITSIVDKSKDENIVKAPAAVPVVIDDPSDTWSHRIFEFKNEIGRFTDASVSIIECGPVRSRIRVKSMYGKSTIQQDFILYAALDYIECRVVVNWQEKAKMLKLSFPVDVESPAASYEIPYGFINRPADGEEEPGQQWIDVTGLKNGEEAGLSIATDSCYSYDIEESDMRVTLLRSPVFAHHDPNKLDPEKEYTYTDQGIHELRYILYPHSGKWNSDTVRHAHELNAPVNYIVDTWHEGTDKAQFSFVSISAENVEASVLKMAEDEDGIILRCYETCGRSTDADIQLPFMGKQWNSHFAPSEIKTFKIALDKNQSVDETDFLELID